MVFWALLMPLLLILLGLGMDLGWYYLTVSRLQNAADAAVVAGAYKLTEQPEFSDYFVKVLTIPPSDITEYDQVRFNTTVEQLNLASGEEVAKYYSIKNLGQPGANDSEESTSSELVDVWNTSSDNEVTLSAALYAKIADAQWNENGIRYYRVTLTEKVSHLFLRNFAPMKAVVESYAILHPHAEDLITIIKQLEDTKVITNWEYQNKYHDTTVKWNHYRQTVNGKKAVSYVAGEYFRTETVNVEVQPQSNSTNNGFKSGNDNHSSGQKTSANGNTYYNEMDVDSLNIDFNQDLSNNISKKYVDWDLGADPPAGIRKVEYVAAAMDGWDATHGYDLRIQGLINFRDAWVNRNLMDSDTSNDLTPDPLWVRIESDPWWIGSAAPYINSSTGLDSVRQMIISIDKSNVDDTTRAFKFTNNKSKVDNTTKGVIGDFDGYEITGGKAYKYRPFFIFYKGPEVYDENNTVRKSQPVILNLNADWNGILYAPNSPVVILGNGNKLTGFVIAKEFVRLAKIEDYTSNGYGKYTDPNGKDILVKSEDIITESELKTEYPATDYRLTKNYNATDTTKLESLTVYKLKHVPKHFIVEAQYVKGMSGYNDNNYVAALKKYREVTDADIVQIKFPNYDDFGAENNHQTYHVVASDLLDENLNTVYGNAKDTFLNAEYVPVIVTSTNEAKYIAKKNLPHVRMYINKGGDKYPYVPVCDIKFASNFPANTYSVNGATLADDTHDVYANKNLVSGMEDYRVDDGLDQWKVVAVTYGTQTWYNYSDSNANPAQITKTTDNGMKYFISIGEETVINAYNENPDSVATYTYVGNDSYVSNDYFSNGKSAYYTYYEYVTNQDKIDGNPQNVIKLVMDNKGNVQTKALPDSAHFQITNDYKFQPDDKGWRKKIRDLNTGKKTKDYRLPEYEVVYYKSAFNLSEDSCYSYFQIPELKRKNYSYLNVDELNHIPEGKWNVEDMFFTTRRANWID